MLMYRLLHNHKLLLTLYGCLVLVVGALFLVKEQHILQETDYNLPLLFLIRFSVFWFMCLMVALAGFLLYLSYNQSTLPEPDKVYAARLGRMALYLGITGCSLAFICFMTLRHYPFN